MFRFSGLRIKLKIFAIASDYKKSINIFLVLGAGAGSGSGGMVSDNTIYIITIVITSD